MSGLIPIAVSAAVFLVVVALGVLGASFVQASRRRRVARRLASASASGSSETRQQWFQRVAAQGQRFDSLIEDPEETTILFAQAGWSGSRSRAVFYGVQLLLPVLALIAAIPFWFVLVGQLGVLFTVMALVVLVLAAAVLPRMALRNAAKNRRERIRAETPLFINLIVLLFEAGLNTRQALTSLVRDGAKTLPEIAQELRPVLRQVEAGAELTTLLRHMGKTLAVQDLDSVLAVLRQVERYGGEIREPLTEALETIEERRTMEIRETVNVLSGKMTVVLVACFFPALLVFIVGPAFMSISSALSSIGGGS